MEEEKLSDVVWGKWSYGTINQDKVIIRVGRFCSIGRGVSAVGLLGHHKEWITAYPFGTMWDMKDAPHPITEDDNIVIIKNDVWVGAYSMLLGGTVLNDGVIVGAGSVVKKVVPPYSIVLGNPAVVIGKRFSDEVIEKLLEIKWWDWEDDKIREYVPLLCSDKVDEFIRSADGKTDL